MPGPKPYRNPNLEGPEALTPKGPPRTQTKTQVRTQRNRITGILDSKHTDRSKLLSFLHVTGALPTWLAIGICVVNRCLWNMSPAPLACFKIFEAELRAGPEPGDP